MRSWRLPVLSSRFHLEDSSVWGTSGTIWVTVHSVSTPSRSVVYTSSPSLQAVIALMGAAAPLSQFTCPTITVVPLSEVRGAEPSNTPIR